MTGVSLAGKTKNQGFLIVPAAIGTVVVGLVLVLLLGLFGAGISLWLNSRGDSSGEIACASWANAPAEWQSIINDAANKAKIQPALLGAIYLSEHNNEWYRPPGDDWANATPAGERRDGPFQIIPSTLADYWNRVIAAGYADGITLEQFDRTDFRQAALAAAFDLKAAFERVDLPTTSSNQTAIMYAGIWYNRGPVYALQWSEAGYNLNVPPSGGAGWGVAHDYAHPTWNNFQNLNKGCSATSGNYAGNNFINACGGGATTASGGGGAGGVIVIDPGHGLNNHAGAEGEKEVNLEVALQVTSQLRAKGYTVYMTRNDPNGGGISTAKPSGNNDAQTDEDNKRRAEFGGTKGAALSFRIHADSGAAPGFYMMYPAPTTKDRTGHVGPSATIASQSKTMSEKISSSLEGQGITKQKNPQPDPIAYGQSSADNRINLVGSTYSTVPVSLIEMFGMKSGNASSTDYQKKMATGIANAIAAAVTKGSGATQQAAAPTSTLMTKACALANKAIETAKDVKAHECPDGLGCKGGERAEYLKNGKARGFSQFATYFGNQLSLKNYDGKEMTVMPFGGSGESGFSSCSRFVGTMARVTFDTKIPLETTGNQWEYYKEHPELYKILPYSIKNAQPGDIVFRGNCNVAKTISGNTTADIDYNCKRTTSKGGFGHTTIYTGSNSIFTNGLEIQASLGNHGPASTSSHDGVMGIIVRIKDQTKITVAGASKSGGGSATNGSTALPIRPTDNYKVDMAKHGLSIRDERNEEKMGTRTILNGTRYDWIKSGMGIKGLGEAVDLIPENNKVLSNEFPVFAPFNGKIIYKSPPEALIDPNGGFIIIESSKTPKTYAVLAHLDDYNGQYNYSEKSKHQSVKAGDRVGKLKMYTGTQGPHLHFELWVNGSPINVGKEGDSQQLWIKMKHALGF